MTQDTHVHGVERIKIEEDENPKHSEVSQKIRVGLDRGRDLEFTFFGDFDPIRERQESSKPIVYAIVNDQAVPGITGVNESLNIVGMPDEPGTDAIYSDSELEEARDDLKKLQEQFGDHLRIRELEIGEVVRDE